jgi:hypothetical protein
MAEFTGRISSIAISYATGKPLLTLECDEHPTRLQEMIDGLRAADSLTIKIGKFRKKRSLDANAYYWLLVGKLAKVLKISMPHCHNLMLRRYGTLEEFDGRPVYIIIQDTDEASSKADEAETYHIKPTAQVKEGNDGLMYRTYLLLKGSHDYDTAEMSDLIEGLVDECKNVGIETATPDEIANMLSLWQTRRDT